MHIIDVRVEQLPSDITVPQTYKVNCITMGDIDSITLNFYYDDDTDIELSDGICRSSDGFSCNKTLDVDPEVSFSSIIRHNLLTVTWEAEAIGSGAFRQDNNNGDHRIRCGAEGRGINRVSDYITVRGNYIDYLLLHHGILYLSAPKSSPTDVRITLDDGYIVHVAWTYNTSDADGYVVYYNDKVKKVEGGYVTETLLGLEPGTTYNIKVRAYQDILGPSSRLLEYTKG